MNDEPTIKLVVEKKRLLQDLASVDGLIAEYGRFLRNMGGDGSWEEEGLALIKAHQGFLNNAKVSLRAVDLVGAITREVLTRLGVEKITMKVRAQPAGPEGAAAAGGGEALRQELEQLIAQINGIAKAAPIAMQEKVRYLLLSSLNLFKGLVDKDEQAISDSITQIHLLTSSRESENLIREIALIAREIYNTLNTLSEGIPIVDTLTESTEGISEAARKLKAVVVKLEEAAFGNLDSLEALGKGLKEEEKVCVRVLDNLQKTQQFLGEMKTGDTQADQALLAVQEKLGDRIGAGVMSLRSAIHENADTFMSLTANQSFQDLTGQTLKKTIVFIEDLEMQLVGLLKRYKPVLDATASKPQPEPKRAEGAADPPQEQQSQDQVDQLLADLGF